MTSTTASDRYTISEKQHNRMIRQSELQLALANTVEKKFREGSNEGYGKFTTQDVVITLARMTAEWTQRLPKKGT